MMDDENDDGDDESSMGRRHISGGSSMGQKCNGDGANRREMRAGIRGGLS